MPKNKTFLIIIILAIILSWGFFATRVLGVTIGGNLNMGNNRIISLAIPINPGDAVNLQYVNDISYWRKLLGGSNVYLFDNNWNVGIGTNDAGSNKLKIVGGTTEAAGGLIMQKITNAAITPEPTIEGSIWMCSDADGQCDG